MKKPRPNVRIIAGTWRGRKVYFPDRAKLRPTPDRVRETLFNWLAPSIRNAQVLDLFSGSGVLGIEALSRGAKQATFVEQDPSIAQAIEKTLSDLKTDRGIVKTSDVLHFLQNTHEQFDIVFLDPPYSEDSILLDCLEQLLQQDCLSSEALVYVENNHALPIEKLSEQYQVHREKKAGQVYYYLLARI